MQASGLLTRDPTGSLRVPLDMYEVASDMYLEAQMVYTGAYKLYMADSRHERVAKASRR